ncbi:hypothetical protein A2331_06950 [Candidatus Falkowbacteria bacterium RIFOXYB2_FULL_34_18]|uniref:SbsA Ig-like domain-containing protein n=1 Tax=Candidatus Falkowbacteria bacterium RIFOXYD2_FULL_34_120 TaxID=1798007 RepID=A0A1F5TRJ0_9BACT|nr:MAG: hypothetical protein A2331_06950 [Candidatus Falkowbacteria bacterium RIFOXYB2_FULL_34_18]OGF29940.1 MAG: hypothetical protein A2500_03725 [Candidatus Falkowbacteria bacterium RIFOXYC12_FULL_34_55]OGF37202.1 MAG: hypothetical protein A2466_02790 [Candidatus Falkowbacteria bacterium RIFOXYC2_FULL_34_220]OGF39478.1 MAG: hypothetical protein A2515_04100 [Candidatus Falkowbacteria bacterium RIFOXYD12_FULL_34_57]OGF41540.1 MAG: hypothetical protein A2531_02505 [Candidatus Falkowbacteria bact
MSKKYQNLFNNQIIKISLCFILIIIFLFGVSDFVFAQTGANNLLWGGQAGNIQSGTGLGSTDIRIVIARVIQIFLGFLGIIAIVLIVYAGWLWMSSAGDSSKIDKAKKTLIAAIIGFIIILASFGIVSFLLKVLNDGTGGLGGGSRQNLPIRGTGAIGNCVVETVYPVPNQQDVPRNVNIIVTFKEEIDPTSIRDGAGNVLPGSVQIFKRGTNPMIPANLITDIQVSVTPDNKTFVFDPTNYLGSPSEYVWYTVLLTNNIDKADGDSAFDDCFDKFYEWDFEVNNRLDLVPPQVRNVIPAPDNSVDISAIIPASPAIGTITVTGVPDEYAAASHVGVNWVGALPAKPATVTMNPHCTESGVLTVSVSADASSAQLSRGGVSLGSASINGASVIFNNFLTLTLSNYPADYFEAGNSWNITGVTAEVQADYLIVGNKRYVFGVDIASNPVFSVVAQNIANALISNTQIDVFPAFVPGNNFISLMAKVAGITGNSIELSTNDSAIFNFILMNGGVDLVENITINSREDEPRNVVIQINFNEAINPMNVSGDAVSLQNYLKVKCIGGLNCNAGNPNLFACGADLCVQGEFVISNVYRTVEFVSNNECAVNACGDTIYCLPADSNIEVDINAATLDGCVNCNTKSPYTACIADALAVNHCHDSSLGIMYPLASFAGGLPDGVVDAAGNSLDGDRSSDAEGPMEFYNENSIAPPGPVPLPGAGDSFRWSFFINSKINLTPPEIKDIDANHEHLDNNVSLSDPVLIDFDIPIMSNTLSTGETNSNGTKHKKVNLWSATGIGAGYWVSNIGFDDSPPDGKEDWTRVQINHSDFAQSTTYRTQIGSGIKSIYQNCFKPSWSNTCSGIPTEVSCCGEVPTAAESCPGF